MEFLIEFFQFLKAKKKLWLAPMMLVFLLFAVISIIGQGSIVSPFIYTLF